MACATCHDPDTGGTGSVSGVNLHQVVITGANPHTGGNLKPPTNAYASLIAPFSLCNIGGVRAVLRRQFLGRSRRRS
jgi:cytochrome c peroxidase